MVKSKRGTSVDKYQELKFSYNKLLSSEGVSKGDVRAYVGLLTAIRETELSQKGVSGKPAHIRAFEYALDKLKVTLRKGNLVGAVEEQAEKWRREGQKKEEASSSKRAEEAILPPPIPNIKDWGGDGLSLVSLFSGALGLDLGFLAAGFDMKYANDIEEDSKETVEKNLPKVPFGLGDFGKIDNEEVLETTGLKRGELDVLTGGPPCQPFSTAGKRQGLNDPRSSPLTDFIQAIEDMQPKAFVMEEVTGLKSARLKHVPIKDRDRELEPEEQKGSVFDEILDMFDSTGYDYIYDTVNAANYGSPQKRRRLIFIGLRDGEPNMPKETNAPNPKNKLIGGNDADPWRTFWEATADLSEKSMNSASLSGKKEYMELVPPAGYWRHLPDNKVKEAMGGAYNSGGGRMGYFRRLSWDEPTPTVVTSPNQKSTMLGHPERLRPLSVEEYKRIQGFPDDWEIEGSLSGQYKLIGNAVPVHLSYEIAKHVKKILSG